MKKTIFITKGDGERELFDPLKLEMSLRKSGATDTVITTIVNKIYEDMSDGVTTTAIYRYAFDLLKEMQKPAAARYSLRRSIIELGPTGFPFEKYIAELFKARGYNALVDQVLLGACVPHEVDVVAWDEKKLLMSEVKFHAEMGNKTDLKIALYVKARFDDLRHTQFDYGHPRHLDEGWLITNTKFSETAVHYGKCVGLKMLSWNYPEQGNLQDLIEELNFHPITSLTTISGSQKNMLFENQIVLCKQIAADTGLLDRHLSLSAEQKKSVLEELAYLTK
ncbi:MAG: ATPase [Candidatus Pacebacteria bacterium]|nr:ATPase [Candidatus Paceibacterota bacterium]